VEMVNSIWACSIYIIYMYGVNSWYIYIYIYVCVCVSKCMEKFSNKVLCAYMKFAYSLQISFVIILFC
jgi:hypothetical protein